MSRMGKKDAVRNGLANDHCCNFILTIFLLFSVIIQTATSVQGMAVSGGEDIGCRWSNPQDFEREMGLHFTSNKMDWQMCLNYCRINGDRFAAVSEGRKCSCGNEVSSLKKTSPQYRCNSPCLGNIKYRCGGTSGYFQLFKMITPAGKSGFNGIYMGCFKEEDDGPRQLPELFSDTTLMTVGRCALSCHSRFRRYAALQRGTQCWCGDNPSAVSLLEQLSNSSSCNVPCLNAMTTCGGKEHTQMYALDYVEQRETPLAMYVGCFVFMQKWEVKNVMHDYAITKVESNEAGAMSISRCCYLCTVKQKPYAGLLRGDTCYCSIVLNSERERFRYDDGACNRPCTENKNFFCGGDAAMQVYKLRPLGYHWETFGFRIET